MVHMNATSIKPMANLDFDMMPAVGINIMVTDDISLISSNRPNTSAQSINLPWLNQESTSSRNTPHTSRGSTPYSKRGCVTLSHLSPIRKTQDQSLLASALQENPFQP
ncbi:unnamed protein product [Rhizophagus irregularis]|nr:unnamed protein product [Rhizophagus irregularis]